MLTPVVESKSRCRAEACSHLLGALELNINKNSKQVIFLRNEIDYTFNKFRNCKKEFRNLNMTRIARNMKGK
jgi:hypothetical protein